MDIKKTAAVLCVLIMAFACVPMPQTYAAEPNGSIKVVSDHGTLTDADGKEYTGGEFTGPVTLTFTPNGGYEFLSWNIEGECTHREERNRITIGSAVGEVTVEPLIRSYAKSHGQFDIIDVDCLLGPDDDLVNRWSFASSKLDRSGNGLWKGMPSVPLIVGDTVYVRAGGLMYGLDVETGVAKYVAESPGTVSFFHHISYGNGVIYDTISHMAFDLELNHLFDLPYNLEFLTYYDGQLWGFIKDPGSTYFNPSYHIFQTSEDPDADLKDGVKQNLSKCQTEFMIFEEYMHYSSFMIKDGWFFFPESSGKDYVGEYRALTAFNPETDESATVELPYLFGMPWDDAWLTTYNDYFSLTAYVAGLFSGIPKGMEDRYSCLTWVHFDFEKGCWGEPRFQDITTPDGDRFRSIPSGLVIHEGRGYLNVRASEEDTLGHTNDVGTCMISYDIAEDGTPIPRETAKSLMTHGGIVVNTAHRDEGQVHIYMIPYESSAQGIYIFTDRLTEDGWKLDPKYVKKGPTHMEWGSQAIRAGPNGEIIYYVDDGFIGCYAPDSNNRIAVLTMDSETATSSATYAKDPAEAVTQLFPGAAVTGSAVTIGSQRYTLYGLNELSEYWSKLSDPHRGTWSGTANQGNTVGSYKYIALLEEGSDTHFSPFYDNGWYYEDEKGQLVKCYIKDKDDIDRALGKNMRYYSTNPNGLVLPNSITVLPDTPYLLEVSRTADWTYSMQEGGPATAEPVKDHSLRITSEGGGTSVLKIQSNGIEYTIVVNCISQSFTDEEGFNVTVSENEEDAGDGSKVSTVTTTRTKDSVTEVCIEKKVKDRNGTLIGTETRNTVHDADSGTDPDGNVIESITESWSITDGSGKVTESGSISTETSSDVAINGTVRETVRTVVTDTDGKKTVKDMTVLSKDMLEVRTISCTLPDGTEENSTEASFTLDTETEVRTDGNRVHIDLSGKFDLDIVTMRGLLGNGEPICMTVYGEGSVSSANLISAGKASAEVICRASAGDIVLQPETALLLGGRGDMTFSAVPAEADSMNRAQRQAAGDSPVFDIRLSCNGAEQHDFGVFTMIIPMELSEEQAGSLKVWRINGDGGRIPAADVSYTDGSVRFDANHLSLYMVETGTQEQTAPEEGPMDDHGAEQTPGEDRNTVMIAVCTAAAVMMLMAAVMMLRRR